jgi:hypothetical protein
MHLLLTRCGVSIEVCVLFTDTLLTRVTAFTVKVRIAEVRQARGISFRFHQRSPETLSIYEGACISKLSFLKMHLRASTLNIDSAQSLPTS